MTGLLTDILNGVANSLNVTTEVAGLLLTAFILFGVGMTISIVKRGKGDNQLTLILVMLASMGALTAIGWSPVWLLMVAVIMVAALFGVKMMEGVGR